MPVIKSAKKKLRQDKKRQAHNDVVEQTMKKALKAAKKAPTAEAMRVATKATDKAVKHHIIHRNKAARVKSALAKLIAGKEAPKTEKATATTAKKAPAKKATKTAKK